MHKIILGLTAAAATLVAGAAMAHPYGDHRGGYGYDRGYSYDHGYGYSRYRDSDGDGVSDRREWGRDRDRDGRPDQWDRFDNRRGKHWRHHSGHHRHQGWDDHRRYDRYR
ncbi:hypothetical protein [uncultured Phenylobacterium sp.]|uniref:hypothetical protein n=1 Tax=uncultured Phenylobacterium sp. TaxID=349273 RepID=UPI0025E740B9|nr:hypothetical protein [uncultured Phenylobacterium sp.]